jgi:hypothetical protein
MGEVVELDAKVDEMVAKWVEKYGVEPLRESEYAE